MASQEDKNLEASRPKRKFMEVASTHSFLALASAPTASSSLSPRRSAIQQQQSQGSTHNNSFVLCAANEAAAASSSSPPKRQQRTDDIYHILVQINPKEYAKAGFRANGQSVEAVRAEAQARFQSITTDMTDAYTHRLVTAFRQNDMTTIRQLHADGQLTTNACNAFGESILHIASRRGNIELVQFLLEEVGIDPRHHRDDYHRTALHDACWTASSDPAFDVIDALMDVAPEHLLLKDKRGFTPLDYIRPKDHGKWLRFLWERKTKLRASSSMSAVAAKAVVAAAAAAASAATAATASESLDNITEQPVVLCDANPNP